MKTALIAALGLAALGSVTVQDRQIDLDLTNKENVVASCLAGTWKYHADLTQKLGGDRAGVEGAGDAKTFTFTMDRTAIPDEELKKLAGRVKVKLTAYAIGRMKMRDQEYPFLLTTLHGNPHVLYFRERKGDPFGDAESFNVMAAKGRDAASDLLFLGGDFNNQPFSALERVK